MILNTTSFKNVKRNEQFLKNKKLKNNKKKLVKKSNSDFNLISIKIGQNNNYKSVQYKKNNFIRSNTHTNIYDIKDNINNIIQNIKYPNKKTEQSTDFSSNIYNNNFNNYKNNNKTNKNNTCISFSHKVNRKSNYNNFNLTKRGKSKINDKILETINYTILLKNQEELLLTKGKKRLAKSSIQMPYISKNKNKKNNINKDNNKFTGLYNSNFKKQNKLKEEINALMAINQKIQLNKRKSRSFSFKNDNPFKNIDRNINNKKFRQKTLNVKIKFSYQKKKDEFIGINRILMKQYYFRKILEQKISTIKSNNKNRQIKIKKTENKICVLKNCIAYFKINNIINHNIKLLNIILEKYKSDIYELCQTRKKYNNEIDKINIKIKYHNKKRNEIKFWYELFCRVKGDFPIKRDNNDMVNFLLIDDLSKGFNHLAEKIMTVENKYKNINDEVFMLKKEKNKLNDEYKFNYERDNIEIKNKEEELNILKYIYGKLCNKKNNEIDKKIDNFFDIKKNNNIFQNNKRYNLYLIGDYNDNIIIQKIGKLFENYIYYFKRNEYFTFEEKEKIKKLNKEIFFRSRKRYTTFKIEKIKKNIFEILYIIEKYINCLIDEINQKKENIGKEKYKQITKNVILLKRIEKKLNFLYNKENDNDKEINLMRKENKINFLPIKKVYVPYIAIKNENMKYDLKKLKNKSFSYTGKNNQKNFSFIGENQKLKTNKNLYYLDDDDANKYNELFFE